MKVLFGPLHTGELSHFMLKGLSYDHDVRTFSKRDADIRYALPGSTFDDILSQLPAGWKPDLVIVMLPEYECLLAGVEQCPYPTLLVVSDWHINYESVAGVCAMFDAVVSDRAGCDLMSHQDEVPVLYRHFCAYDPDLHRRLPDVEPVYDLSIAAVLDPNLNPKRTRFLVRLAQLGDRWRVRYFMGVVRDAYVQLINQSRITFNYAVRGEMSTRLYEAPACGSLLFCERSNREIGEFLQDGRECVLYDEDDVVELVERYLQDENLRRRVADAGYERIRPYTYRQRCNALVDEFGGAPLGRRAFRSRSPLAQAHALAVQACRAWDPEAASRAVIEAQRALRYSPSDASALNTLGCAAAGAADAASDADARARFKAVAEEAFAAAGDVLGLLNSAQFQMASGNQDAARRLLQRAVADGCPFNDGVFYPRRLDRFFFEWERTRSHRRPLSLWMAYDLLADLEPDYRETHLRAAVAQRPDIGTSWHRLADVLPPGSAERRQALCRALDCDPLLLAARYDLIQALWAEDREQAMRLAAETARVVSAFPYGQQECQRVGDLVSRLSRSL